MDERPLSINSYNNIRSLQKGEKNYLGIDFSDKILLRTDKIGQHLKHNLDLLIGSPLLKAEQKFSVINHFILPKLVYCFQNTPASKMSQTFLTKVDNFIKNSVNEIVQLPADTRDSMLYSSKKVKGLGVYKAQWEAFLQRLNACHILKKSENVYMNSICNNEEEQQKCINELDLENFDSLFNKKLQYIRGTLRLLEYNKWCQLQGHGKRVILFQQFQRANSRMEYTMGLFRTEWTDAIKLQGNLSPVGILHEYISDPTVRFDTYYEQPLDVDMGKKQIY